MALTIWKIGIVFKGLLEEEADKIEFANDIKGIDSHVSNVDFETTEVIVHKEDGETELIPCTIAIIELLDELPLTFKLRFTREFEKDSELIASKESPYIYYYTEKD